MNKKPMDTLFNPRNVTLIGASASPLKWGSMILSNIVNGNYKGTVYPVNPKLDSVNGLKCYASVGDIPEPVDLALITTPAATVPGLIDECGAKGIPVVVVVTSDFSESGPEGALLERALVEQAASYGMRIVGPNTMGIFSAEASLHALMPPVMPLYGPISMLSQSGNIGSQMLYWGVTEGMGYEKFVSSGNEGDLTCLDYLKYFGEDDATRVIVAYFEGVDDGSELLKAARNISRTKPIVVFKGGRTKEGRQAAASHSGSMAGSMDIYRAVFRQSGMIQAETSQQLIDLAKAFSVYPVPQGNRVGILTLGGGWGVITADACAENGLVVPPLPEDLKNEFGKILPKYWSRENPIDMVAVVDNRIFDECLELLADWDGIDSILALHGNASDFMRGMIERTGKPIISVSLGPPDSHRQAIEDYGIVSYPTPERAVQVLQNMAQYRLFLNGLG
ncbi:MAG: hypothetical protein GY866_12035 [Proteobacteria bacterium]|nr:hypothetical protein [Pseudomonadota bacterium]